MFGSCTGNPYCTLGEREKLKIFRLILSNVFGNIYNFFYVLDKVQHIEFKNKARINVYGILNCNKNEVFNK